MPRPNACLLLFALAAPLPAFADEIIIEKPDLSANDLGWSGSGELGVAIAKGNTNNENLVGKIHLNHNNKKWKNAFGASGQYTTDEDIETARRYELYGTGGRRLNERSYIWISLRNERDHFASYEYQWATAFGYGYEAIKSNRQHLTFELGPGYRWSKDQDVRVYHRGAIARGMVNYGIKITPTTSFGDVLLVESGGDNTYIKNTLGLQVSMSKRLALKAGLETRYNFEVEPGNKKTDNLTTVNIVYTFE